MHRSSTPTQLKAQAHGHENYCLHCNHNKQLQLQQQLHSNWSVVVVAASPHNSVVNAVTAQ